jgi:biotin--protein ligase
MQVEKLEPLVLIYDGCGADYECVDWTLAAFRSLLKQSDLVAVVDDKALIDDKWMSTTRILIIPGGRANPYHESLGEVGMENIRKFVHNGGTFVGICAGAYFTAAKSKFAEGTKNEIIAEHLGLFKGEVKGPLFEDFNYLEETIKIIPANCSDGEKRNVYHHGGGWFVEPEEYEDISVLARYIPDEPDKDGPASMIKIKYGEGIVFASHIHFECPDFWPIWKNFVFNALEHEDCLVYNHEQSINI